jgi:hypothetical protein
VQPHEALLLEFSSENGSGTTMPIHTFTLQLSFVGPALWSTFDEKAFNQLCTDLYSVGCGDGLVNSKEGIVYIDFDREIREGASQQNAIVDAIADVQKIPGVSAILWKDQ